MRSEAQHFVSITSSILSSAVSTTVILTPTLLAEHSTIIYESPVHDAKKSTRRLTPLIRLGWNKQDPNYLATFSSDKSFVVILDIRVPSMPVAEVRKERPRIVVTLHKRCYLVSEYGYNPNQTQRCFTAMGIRIFGFRQANPHIGGL